MGLTLGLPEVDLEEAPVAFPLVYRGVVTVLVTASILNSFSKIVSGE